MIIYSIIAVEFNQRKTMDPRSILVGVGLGLIISRLYRVIRKKTPADVSSSIVFGIGATIFIVGLLWK